MVFILLHVSPTLVLLYFLCFISLICLNDAAYLKKAERNRKRKKGKDQRDLAYNSSSK